MKTVLSRIEDNPHLLDIMIAIEDLLDSMDMYVYANWIDGELVEGPIIKRYWITAKLKYEYEQMPDPAGAARLLKSGVIVKFNKREEEITLDTIENRNYNPSSVNANEPPVETKEVWIVSLDIPRKLLGSMTGADVDFYDEDVDVDDIESAIDMGITNTTGLVEGKAMITEGMKSGDLSGLVNNVVTVGNFKSKIDDSVIVFTFEAKDSSVAKEIRRFIQKGYSDILDVEVSSTPNHIGNYTIFVEVENNQKAARALSSICDDVLRLVDFDEWMISFNGITGVFRSKTNGIEDLFVQYVKPYVDSVNSKIVGE